LAAHDGKDVPITPDRLLLGRLSPAGHVRPMLASITLSLT
jgi:hypothetical protein